MLYELLSSPEFADWQAELTFRIRERLDKVYAATGKELDFVKALVEAVRGTAPARSAIIPGLKIDVESEFLHGPRSMVSFSVAGEPHERELADLLVLSSFVEKNELRWQRVCFVQAKLSKALKTRSSVRFDIDRWQMELLRRFAEFSGVSGVFRGRSFKLRNFSGMLGAYALLTEIGEFSIATRALSVPLSGAARLSL